MEIKEFVIKQIRIFFMLVTFVTIAMIILGLIFEPAAGFGYEVFAFPLVYALCGVLPGAVMYSKRELSVRQTIVRKIVQLVVIEAEILFITGIGGLSERPAALVALGAAVLVIFIAVNVTEYLFDMNTALKLNSGLNRLHTEE